MFSLMSDQDVQDVTEAVHKVVGEYSK